MIGFNDIVKFGKEIRDFAGQRIPLHFLVYREPGPNDEKGYGVALLDLGLFAWGITAKDAQEAMEQHLNDYLGHPNVDEGSLDVLLGSTAMEHYWAIYRRLTLYYGNPDPISRELDITINQLQKLQNENQDLREAVNRILPALAEEQREHSERIMEIQVTLDGIQKRLDSRGKKAGAAHVDQF